MIKKSLTKRDVNASVALVFLLLAVGWKLLAPSFIPRYPANFSYSADLISVDNFYDESNQRFSGDQYSNTNFSYQVVSQDDEALVVRNIFDVKTLGGEKIFNVERYYGVDRFTGMHIPPQGDELRSGYLFAPKNLRKRESFVYWHVNYDGPAEMHFQGEQTLYGLPLYHYTSDYEGVRIDQTDNLDYLPGVPEERGVVVEPHLELWIEPVSGFLVKYKDDSTAYYYDQKTGEKIHPWNKFSNTYSEESVRKIVRIAEGQKLKENLISGIIPFCLLVLGILIFMIKSINFRKLVSAKILDQLRIRKSLGRLNFQVGFGISLIGFGLIVLAGWVFDYGLLIRIYSPFPAMHPLTALMFMLLGVSIIDRSRWRFYLLMAIAVISSTKLAGKLMFDFEVDQLVNDYIFPSRDYLARVSQATSLSFLLIALGTIAHLSRLKQKHAYAAIAYVLAIVFSLIGIMDYWYPTIGEHLPLVNGLAIHTAAGLLIASTILLLNDLKVVNRAFAKYSQKFIVAFLTLLLPLILTLTAWQISVRYSEETIESKFEVRNGEVVNVIKSRAEVYVNALEGAKGLFVASEEVSRQEWKKYIDSLRLQKNYPGVQGVGYATFVRPDELNKHINEVRSQGFPDYKVWPEGSRDLYSAIVYLEPFDERNQRAFGYDMFSEPNRNQAMTKALESGEAAMSAKITLVQEYDEEVQAGFLIYLPIYKNDVSLKTLEDRRQNIQGFVYSPFRMNDFVNGVFTEGTGDVSLEIFDGVRLEDESKLFSNKTTDSIGESSPFVAIKTIYIAGRPWTLRVSADPGFGLTSEEQLLETLILVAGIVLSCFLYITFASLTGARRKAMELAKKLTKDLKQYSVNLAKEKAKDEAMLLGIGDGLIATDSKGKIVLVNGALEKLFGYKQSQIVGMQISQDIFLFDKKGKKLLAKNCLIMRTLRNGKIISNDNTELYFQNKSQQMIPIAITVSPIILNSKIAGAIAVIRDISKEKEIDKAKSEFVSLASHQLRTPLSSIRWFIEMLLNGDGGRLSAGQRRYLKQMEGSNKRMIDLVNSLLNVSRLELGTFKANITSVSVRSLINSVKKELAPELAAKKLRLKIRINPKVKNFEADEKLVRMVIQNLLSNAVKYTEEKGKIDVEVAYVNKGSAWGNKKLKKASLAISIKDSGLGIPKKQHGKVFTKLFRSDNVKSADTQGTGLGLYIVKSIVEQTGGEIWFVSEENVGTAFYVTFPRI